MKKRSFCFALMGIIMSCSFENETPYYIFSRADYEYIPTVNEDAGKIITLRNQAGQISSYNAATPKNCFQ